MSDLIQLFKITRGKDKVVWVKEQRKINSIIRGHNSRYERELTKKSSHRYNFFMNRTVNNWNRLDQETIDSESVNAFKRSLDKKLFGVLKYTQQRRSHQTLNFKIY